MTSPFGHSTGAAAPSLGGGIGALALVSALGGAATFALVATTALHLAWPNAAFQWLAALMAAALLFAHARDLSPERMTFALGVLCGAAPSLLIAARHSADHWDDYMTWLPNALYLWKFGGFPTEAAPPVASLWPAYPPGSSIILASIWSVAGRVVEPAGPMLNVACLMILPALVWRAIGGDMHRGLLRTFMLGAALALAATMLNVGLDWHWVLSSLPDTATLVAFAVAFRLGAEAVVLRLASPRSHLAAFAAALALIANLKQTGIVLDAVLMLALLLVAWSWNGTKRQEVRHAVLTLGIAFVPAFAVWLCWQLYLARIFAADAAAIRPLGDWHYSLLPDLLRAIMRNMAQHWLLSVPLLAVLARGWYILGRRFLARERTEASPADRLAAVFALAGPAYWVFLIACFLDAFTDDQIRRGVEWFRYQSHVSNAGLLAAVAVIMESLPRRQPILVAPIVVAAEIATAASIWPAAGIFQSRPDLSRPDLQQVRQIGRRAGRMIAAAGEPATVEIVSFDHLMADLVVNYETWAAAPFLVRRTYVTPADGRDAALTDLTVDALKKGHEVVAMRIDEGVHCAVRADHHQLEPLVTGSDAEICRPLLSVIAAAVADDRNVRAR